MADPLYVVWMLLLHSVSFDAVSNVCSQGEGDEAGEADPRRLQGHADRLHHDVPFFAKAMQLLRRNAS